MDYQKGISMEDISRQGTEFYRYVHTDEDGEEWFGESYSRASTAKGVSTMHLRWRSVKPAVRIQHLEAHVPEDGTVHDAELIWVDYDG